MNDSRRCDRDMGRSRRHRENDVPAEVLIPDRRFLTLVFPGLRLVGAIRQAFDLRKVIIAALGLAILQPGWSLVDLLVPSAADTTPDVIVASVPALSLSEPGLWSRDTLVDLHARLSEPFRLMASPLFALVDPAGGWRRTLHAALSVLWLIIVWSICGGAISRIAIVQVAALRQTPVVEALRFALTNAGSLMMAPLCPLLGVALCAGIGALFGLLYRVPWLGPALAGIGLIVPLAGGFVMTLLVAAMLGGWPLLQAATAGGAEDALDALSRIFGYINQRLGSYVALVALAWLAGMLGLALVDFFTAGVIRLTQWSLGLTAPFALTSAFFGSPPTSPPGIAGATHAFWLGLVRLLAHGWIYSFYWTVAANLYLWLRHDVDGTPWTEIEPAGSQSGPSPA
jgi:hypothetical protein